MVTRALCAISMLLGGCTIHIVEGPATSMVAESPVRHHRSHQVASRAIEDGPGAEPATPRPEPALPEPTRTALPARSDLTPARAATPSRKPPVAEPTRTRYRDVRPRPAASELTTIEHERHKVKEPGT